MTAEAIELATRPHSPATDARRRIAYLFSLAGIAIDGPDPGDIHVHDGRFYQKLLAEGSLGLGESYVDGWWDCQALDEAIYRMLRAGLHTQARPWTEIMAEWQARLFNRQTRSRALEVGRRHYDIGNELYRRMLDRRMIYSCGYWCRAGTLDQAQEAKLDLVCRKLGLKPGMRVLDIGCGWGGGARFAAERYGVEVVAITISREQADEARETCRGLPVTILLQDYRDITGTFDRVYSIGMFEHVGYKNYRTYLRTVADHLAPDGLFLLHTIGSSSRTINGDAWAERYIFPNSMLPAASQITAACEDIFQLEDWHNFGQDYDRTLMEWWKNFERHWDQLKSDYDDRFFRTWRYYLLSFAGAFRASLNHVWQIVMAPQGSAIRYEARR